jgi:hypothetical protein
MTDHSAGYSLTHDIQKGLTLTSFLIFAIRRSSLLYLRADCAQPLRRTLVGLPFLFLLTVEFLIYDSSHWFSNRNTFFLVSSVP